MPTADPRDVYVRDATNVAPTVHCTDEDTLVEVHDMDYRAFGLDRPPNPVLTVMSRSTPSHLTIHLTDRLEDQLRTLLIKRYNDRAVSFFPTETDKD